MDSNNFKTKTLFTNKKSPCNNNKYYPIGLDIGYSGVKCYAQNKIFCFPAYAIKVNGPIISLAEPSKNDIWYRDEKDTWYVGELAQLMTNRGDTSESNSTLYTRNRFEHPMFRVLARVSMGIAMMSNEYGNTEGKIPIIQTGLPPRYLKEDLPKLKKPLVGHHEFEIKIGKGKWQKFCFDLPENHIFVMPQPLGSLKSLTTNIQGEKIKEFSKYLDRKVNILIMDAGFGTNDFFNIKGGNCIGDETNTELGMKRVFQETVDEISKRYNYEIPVHYLQNYLDNGTFEQLKITDEGVTQIKRNFTEILNEKNEKICKETIKHIVNTYDFLQGYQYLVLTGGTGAAWNQMIKKYFEKMSSLTIISANSQENLLNIFSNVRGYYYQLNDRLLNL